MTLPATGMERLAPPDMIAPDWSGVFSGMPASTFHVPPGSKCGWAVRLSNRPLAGQRPYPFLQSLLYQGSNSRRAGLVQRAYLHVSHLFAGTLHVPFWIWQ